MQVAIFIALVNQLLPERLIKIKECKSVLDVVVWRKQLINALTTAKVLNEEKVVGPQDVQDLDLSP